MQTVKKIDDYLAKAEEILIVIILSIMILLSFGQVILRNFFSHGILWADIFLRQMVLWVGFLGASLATRNSKHIAINFLPHFMPPVWKAISAIVVSLSASVISSFLAWAAWKFVQFEKEGGAVLFLDLPVWVFQAILPFSFAVIAIRFLLQAVRESVSFSGSRKSGEGEMP